MNIKLNIGCRNKPLPGFVNLDIDPSNKFADIIDNGFILSKFADESLMEIHAVHMAEHLSHKEFLDALLVWYKKLCSGGKLYLSVPDAEKMSALLLLTKDKSSVMSLFYGSQLNEWDFHRSLHTRESLSKELAGAGFSDIKEWDYWNTFPYNYVDTYASAVYPHMRKKIKMDNGKIVDLGGIQMSLNLLATK